ncbi:hypothetical protein H6G54_15260 [Anabaena cylindrica FACHB-243]|uniref:Uncharacterized protein n=1 Tax=Anabaena cylindrica (strain ATCC 27899 / PCC 7122) TaxID=272123 RepID=K9ZL13_ANACC|nr:MULTISPECIES: hypothetical protein [Anabaena]AFZ59938.1 hypothetical protein Anacy_4586 [Anabaena cylindrica PCC 7122]MBD2419031.1 hypothetical protein [Anabaena cylindrica FACHB-243]MBY5282687.1 hypothetical protein [Anabaena sp. CCAP 1446/1C]MBY5307563.1 hypothetical protein [Anabaena sp. CCAP 1446/1C]MCM2407841.1 hypothetical protein [Anabaena sp. CCAP 1446/1C]
MLNLKTFSNLSTNINHRLITSSLMLTAMLSVSSGITLMNSSFAVPNPINIQQRYIKNNKIQPIPIPTNELPPPLDRGMVFREISSGGITGRTYQTILLNDGLLMRVRIGDANDSERSVRRVSLQQVKQFEKLLNQNNITKFKNLNYPAPSGAADYINYTLTSQKGTFQYNDISQNGLPNKLQSVISAWNQLKNKAQ